MTKIDVKTHRTADYPIDDQFLTRWSPRAYADMPVTEAQMMSLFEAARWSPSCFNDQPWVFFYALNGDDQWSLLFDSLVEFNQGWVAPAGALICVAARQSFSMNGKPNAHANFDAGAAWMSIALQAEKLGLITHAMAGFDAEAASKNLNLPEDIVPLAMVAVGYPGAKEILPEGMAEKETPSQRNATSTFTHHGAM